MSEDIGGKVRDQLPFVTSINSLITEAERLRFYGRNAEYNTAVLTIYRKAAAVRQLKPDLEKQVKDINKWYTDILTEIISKRSGLINPAYIEAERRERTVKLEYSDKCLAMIQTVLDKHDMLLKTYGSERSSL